MAETAVEQFDEDGEDKKRFLEQMQQLRPDLFFPEGWTKEQKEKAADMVRPMKMRTSLFTSIPMRCYAEKCQFADICPLMQEGLAPKGLPCPIEMSAVQQFMTEYMLELGVESDNLIEVSMVRDLVDQEIQQMRKTWVLSREHFIQENVIGIDPDGKPILRKELHQAVDFEDRIMRRKKSLREQLLATREARARVGQGVQDTAQAVAKLLEQANKINDTKAKALRARLGYDEDYDEYIDAEVVEPDDEG